MPLSLYEAVVPSNLQILGAVDALLDRAEAFSLEQGKAASDLIDARLAPDMLPFGYQVKSCAAHSIGGIEGVKAGNFSPDLSPWPTNLALLAKARGRLAHGCSVGAGSTPPTARCPSSRETADAVPVLAPL